MKKYYHILTILAGAALMAMSCSKLNTTPVFSPDDSFAALTITSASINEDKGQVIIPVQIASIDPVKTSVSYKIVDGTAVAGTDYEDTNTSAVLTFDGKQRSADIVINIKNRAGDYTGDLDFSVELIAASGLKLSKETVCKVTIIDLDHPLAKILGTYEVSCTEHWAGPSKYTMHLLKDPKDVNTVWCDGICPMVAGSLAYSPVYAAVTKDEKDNYVLSFPSGQVLYAGFQDDGNLILCETIYQGGYGVDTKAIIVFNQTGDVVFESTNGMGVVSDSYVWRGGFVYGASTGEQYKTVWTKTE